MGEPTFEEDFVHKEGVPNDDGDIDEIEMQNDCLQDLIFIFYRI